ncbi:MAG: outer membrane lipoprotein carrier protein LolA [Cytophagales bacterium]|nr:outer membrane lipoprotein carrier protein LolA [Cytophagales bacterium]
MKKIFTYLACIAFVSFVFAQNVKQKEARQILDEMSVKLKALNSFKVEFETVMSSPVTKMEETIKGRMIVQGNKYKLLIGGPEPKEIYNNGTTIWTLFPGEEVTISDVDEEDNSMLSISSMVESYKEGYKYMIEGDAVANGKNCDVITLVPEIVNGETSVDEIFKIRLFVEKKTRILQKWVIFEKNGNRYTTSLTSFTPNVKVSPSTFVYDTKAHPNIEVNDMRE